MANRINNFFKKLLGKRLTDERVYAVKAEEPVPVAIAGDYALILNKVNPYFKNLNETEKQKFLHRVYNFRKIKRFHFQNNQEAEDAAILISAAAVQVSFGLKKYLLPFFTDIYVLSDAYVYKGAAEKFIGHVSPTGIYISWKHFVQGYTDYTDGMNVALHEMAHALHHENFIGETGIDWEFREDFDKMPGLFGPMMTKVIVERKSYLRGYAFTNFHEFWAVSVENFFENPQGLKDNLPHLYSILCNTLNQDPLKAAFPVIYGGASKS